MVPMMIHAEKLKGEVGVRELHARLSRYVRHAADGHEVTVTLRGRRVARLVPASADDPLAGLRARGLVQEPQGSWRPRREDRPKAGASIDDLVVEQRR